MNEEVLDWDERGSWRGLAVIGGHFGESKFVEGSSIDINLSTFRGRGFGKILLLSSIIPRLVAVDLKKIQHHDYISNECVG